MRIKKKMRLSLKFEFEFHGINVIVVDLRKVLIWLGVLNKILAKIWVKVKLELKFEFEIYSSVWKTEIWVS